MSTAGNLLMGLGAVVALMSPAAGLLVVGGGALNRLLAGKNGSVAVATLDQDLRKLKVSISEWRSLR